MFARFARRCVLACIAVMPASAAFGQTVPDAPAAVVPLESAAPTETAPPTPTAILTGVPEAAPVSAQPNERIDVIAGLPLAGRYQRRIGSSRYWSEVGAGLFIIVPDVFVGVRSDWGIYEGKRNSIFVRPGLDAHLIVWPFGSFFTDTGSGNNVIAVPGIALDADLVWRRALRDNVHGEFGVKLGVLTLIGHQVLPVPTVGLLCGVQY